MTRIKHIALSTDDPARTAEFYKSVFGLREVRRDPIETGAEGVWLSDGYIFFAILKHGGRYAPDLGEGPSTQNGVHHVGFYVDNQEETCGAIEATGCAECPGSSRANRKYKGPDGLMLDVRTEGWDEQIQNAMRLYRLEPAESGDRDARVPEN